MNPKHTNATRSGGKSRGSVLAGWCAQSLKRRPKALRLTPCDEHGRPTWKQASR